MSDQQFQHFLSELKDYLKQPKMFTTNLDRAREFYHAVDLAEQLFSDATVEIQDDPLQAGAMILCVDAMDIVVRGAKEIKLFNEMVSNASNFEIYFSKGNIHFAAVFQGVHKRV